VEKIDMIISTIQGQLPAKIIFTITSTNPPDVSWTVQAGVNSVTIEASGAGAPGTPAIATSTSGVYQDRGGGGSGQIGNITIPVAEGSAQYKPWGSDASWNYCGLWYLSGDQWHPNYHM